MTAEDLLRRGGWAEDRRVTVDAALAALCRGGYETWSALEEMLASYCGLVVHDASGARSLWIEPARAVANADPDWVRAYEQVANHRLVPVGGYSHLLIMFGRDSVFYGGVDAEFGPLGASMEDVVDGLLCRFPPVRLSMTVD